jgi:hypothetical protein
MVDQLHAPWAAVSEPRRAIDIEFVFEYEYPHVHAVAESVLHLSTGLLQRTRVNRQESVRWHIDPCNISLTVVPRCLEGQVPFSIVMGLFAQSLELVVRVKLVKHGF